MRVSKSWLLALTLGGVATGAVVACSSDPVTDTPDASIDQPGEQPVVDGGDGVAHDATTGDSGPKPTKDAQPVVDAKPDTGRDATPPPADAQPDAVTDAEAGTPVIPDAAPDTGTSGTGTPCPGNGQVQERLCGRCGKESRLCASDGDGGTAWLEWGSCVGEKPTGCYPNTSVNVPCGKCGFQAQVCDLQCNLQPGFCQEPATAVCVPDAGDFQLALSCDAGEGRSRTCQNDCTWTPFSAVCEPYKNPNILTLNATVGQSISGPIVVPAGQKDARISTISCPTTLLTSSQVVYVNVELKNPSAQTLRLSVWQAPTPPATTGVDTVMAAYAGSTPPIDRTQCINKPNDTCSSSDFVNPISSGTGIMCTGGFAGLAWKTNDATSGVTVAPNSSVIIHVAAYGTSQGTFNFTLYARTEAAN